LLKQEPKVVPRSGTDQNRRPSGQRGRQEVLPAKVAEGKVLAHVSRDVVVTATASRGTWDWSRLSTGPVG